MRALIFFLSFSVLSITGCSIANDGNKNMQDRALLLDILHKSAVLHKDRQTVHVSHTCNLQLEENVYFVVDIRELIRGAVVARGINHIVVLNSSMELVQKIEYTTERPLYCLKNQLIVYGNIMINGLLPEGNLLTFSAGAKQVSVSRVDNNELPNEAR